jgi:hypothetical protein
MGLVSLQGISEVILIANNIEFMLKQAPSWYVLHFSVNARYLSTTGIGVPGIWIKLF